MRYAIFSDIHGNLPAWEQVLADIQALEADVLVCLGDVVGYGPKPQEVLDGIRSVTDHFVLGNHDAAAAGLIDPSIFNEHAQAVVLWTRENLSNESLEFLKGVPLEMSTDDILFVHAEIAEPGRFGYIEQVTDAEKNFASGDQFLTFIGHTHHPLMFERLPYGAVNLLPDTDRVLDPKCRYIVNVGSAGEPRNPEDIRARYVIYDSDTRKIYFRRIKFSTNAYRRDLMATSLTHLPYFLEVLDHKAGIEAAVRAQDMMVPVKAAQVFNTAQRRLVIPAEGTSAAKPKPKPLPAPSKDNKSAGVIFLVIGGLAAILIGGWFFLQKSRPDPTLSVDQSLMTESPSTIISPDHDDHETSVAAAPAGPISPLQQLYSAESVDVPNPVERESVVEKPTPIESAPKEPEMAVASQPSPADPLPSEPAVVAEPAPPAVHTVSHWPMDSESITENLKTAGDGVELRQVLPPKPFRKVAPDPLPQSGDENPAALAGGTWEELETSGQFDLKADESFTFEGWVLISPQQPPVFVGGTATDERPGWRLDIKPADTEEGDGSIRFQYMNGNHTVSIQNNEAPINKPEPHHFAVVWNHEGDRPGSGEIEIYLDGELIETGEIPHSEIGSFEDSIFQLGAPTNPVKIAMDEIRFTKGELKPNEFLASEPGPFPGNVVTRVGMNRIRLLYGAPGNDFEFDKEYTEDHSSEIEADSFSRIGYYVELGDDWVWVSMDRFQTDPALLGISKASTKIVEAGTVVKNLMIDSSRADLNALNRSGLTGIIEFWGGNYSGKGNGMYGSSDEKFDWKDSGGTAGKGHGSFQVSAFLDDTETSAINLFGITRTGGAGIGDQPDSPNSPDWTFGPSLKTYSKRNLEIWVGQ